jgi:adenosylcobinamide-GDP ribazoletransferase
VALSLTAACCLVAGRRGWFALAAAAAVFWLWRRAGLRRLDGFTGDTAGAMAELVEAAVLVALALA